jgi:hypothetical protein
VSLIAGVGTGQALTLLIPLGMFIGVLVWGFFQRKPS